MSCTACSMQYVDAALRARDTGFDHGRTSTAHTLTARCSGSTPTTTSRTDQYGGSFDNRARFWIETLEKIRRAVNDDVALVTRCARSTPSTAMRKASNSARMA
jgi:dimethylamine/trimethylamine dehydrogenase